MKLTQCIWAVHAGIVAPEKERRFEVVVVMGFE
jgi:hypothetical protein